MMGPGKPIIYIHKQIFMFGENVILYAFIKEILQKLCSPSSGILQTLGIKRYMENIPKH